MRRVESNNNLLPFFKLEKKNGTINKKESSLNVEETDTILNISKNAKLKLVNSQNNKKAGVTGQREEFEIYARERLQYEYDHRFSNHDYFMKMDEPETYQRMMELFDEVKSQPLNIEKLREMTRIEIDYIERKLIDSEGNRLNPLTGKGNVFHVLELKYSDGMHDTSFNFYSEENPNSKSNIWNYNTKFNVLIPVSMQNTMNLLTQIDKLSNQKKKEVQEAYQKVDEAVSNMKRIEKAYEGNLEVLRFGATIDKNGQILYHANYYRCEDEQGLSSYDPDELLNWLMKK